MPTKRHIRWRKRREPFDAEKAAILATGCDFFRTYGGDEAAMRADWSEHRAEILAAFTAQNPGARPWAWWKFDAPEPRRRVRCGGVRVMPDSMTALTGPDFPPSFGLPSAWICRKSDVENRFETQTEFLVRLKMLTAREAADAER